MIDLLSRLRFGSNLFALALASLLSSCSSLAAPEPAHSAGTLLVVGGGLEDDARAVYERLLTLASAHGPARIVIATAATGEQEVEVADKTGALRSWAPDVQIDVIRRETPTDATVAAIDAASALLFTGGDQQRITDRYRPGERETPEWLAMRRLLARGGVIAGCSAGDAMMGQRMLLGGGSATALGIGTPSADAPLGPRVGPGMGFVPWVITDSHFFERDRVGRLVAALESSGRRLGIGVGEDACVEIDLASGVLTGVSPSEALLVDVAHLERADLARRGVLARLIGPGERVSLVQRLESQPPAPPARPAGAPREVPVVEPGQNRQLASWRLFREARTGPAQLALEDWRAIAWPAGDGEIAFDLEPR
ncbi:MAG: cyanophycinase [Planctomycetes bacterium]|nr:cyanophycinase [Planctomycetota bacterium]